MGSIIKTKRMDERIVVEMVIELEEYMQLQGKIDNVHVYAEQHDQIPARVSLRGKDSRTKYFLIPKQLRKKLDIFGDVKVQRMNFKNKDVYIYSINKAIPAA